MAETKPKSFRVSNATAEKFKEIAGELGGNQQEAMAKLIEAYEFQQGKAVFKKTTEIETFEKYVTLLTRMYMSSLEDNQHINETVHSEFAAQLQAKDAVILDLRNKLEKMDLSNTENITLHQEIKNLENMLQDKDALNNALTKSCDELRSKLETAQNKQKDIDILREQNKELKEQVNTLKKELEIIRQQHTLELEKQQLSLGKKYQQEKQQVIDKYQQKYLELLENTKKPEPVNRKTSSKPTTKE